MRAFADFDGLKRLVDALHDCPFDLGRTFHDVGDSRWRISFYVPQWDHADAQTTRRFLGSVSNLPVAAGTLTVDEVVGIRLEGDQGIERYSLNSVVQTPDGIRFESNQVLTIELVLSGSVRGGYDEELLPGVRAEFRNHLIGQSGPRIIEEASA
jgi:hypothetical protein